MEVLKNAKICFKKTLRKVAAVGTSIAMVGVTLSGALAVGTLEIIRVHSQKCW